MPSLKIGHGYDVHQLVTGRELIIGGVNIPHETGLLGHSDADVLLHAITDAIIGALGMGDIGHVFSDTNSETEGIASTQILADIYQKMVEKGYEIGNIDCTLCAEKPKLNPYIPQMQEILAEVMGVDVDIISIKATTNEKMGFVGREEGLAAYAVALITKTV